MKLFTLAVLFFSAPLFAQADDAIDLTPARWMSEGVYGSTSANFTVSRRSADLDLPCGFGKIPFRPVTDDNGVFRAEGTFTPRLAANPQGLGAPATFVGRVQGHVLWLYVTVHGHTRGPRTFHYGPLVMGQPGLFVRCL